jgi:hypothetical protein
MAPGDRQPVQKQFLTYGPGKKPASNTPRRTRQITNPANDPVQPWPIVTIPIMLLANKGDNSWTAPTPSKHDRAQPDRRSNLLENDIARDLEQDIGNKKYEQSNIELRSISIHVEIVLQTLESCIANIDTTEGR